MNNLPSNRTLNNRFGFTLIELLIVAAVLGVMATFVIVRFTGVQASARDAKRQSELKQYQTSLEVYANRNNSAYPTGTNVEADSLCVTLGVGTGCPDDPLTSQHYIYYGTASSYVLIATLERTTTSGVPDYFVICSNGKVGKTTVNPTSATCPL